MATNVERTEYELQLLAWVQSVVPSSWDVIFADSDGPRPKARYVLLNVLTMPRTGHPYKRVLDQPLGDGCRGELAVHYEGTCEVSCFGKNARTMIETLRTSIDLPSVLESTLAGCLSLVGSTASLNLTELNGTRSTPRFQSDFFFHWSDLTYYEADVIETVTYTET
jgi:hypothetical protein